MADDAKTADATAKDEVHPVIKHSKAAVKAVTKAAGDFHTKLHEKETLKITVTAPAAGETETKVTVPDGRELVVPVPDGQAPGSTFEYEYESKSYKDHLDTASQKTTEYTELALKKGHQLMKRATAGLNDSMHKKEKLRVTVTVPAEYKEGDEITIAVKDGREFSFVAPAGKNSPGDEFEVEYDSKSFHDHLSGFADTLHGHIVRHGSAVIDFGHKHVDNLHAKHEEKPMKSMDVTVPGDSKAGEEFDVLVEDGRTLKATVPDGKGPGDEFKFEYEGLSIADHVTKHGKMLDDHVEKGTNMVMGALADTHEAIHEKERKKMTTSVPAENKEGDEILVVVDDGRTLKVKVPDGKGPGDKFEFEYDGMSINDHFEKHVTTVQGHLNRMADKAKEYFLIGVTHMDKHVAHQAKLSIDVILPAGKKAGDILPVKVKDGRMMNATVPDGVSAGETFTFKYESKSLLSHVYDLHDHSHKTVHFHFDKAKNAMVQDDDDDAAAAGDAAGDEKKSDGDSDVANPVAAVDSKAAAPSKFDIDML